MISDSLGQRERDMGTVSQDPHVTPSYSFMLVWILWGWEGKKSMTL